MQCQEWSRTFLASTRAGTDSTAPSGARDEARGKHVWFVRLIWSLSADSCQEPTPGGCSSGQAVTSPPKKQKRTNRSKRLDRRGVL
jgi:hypothetical protein